MLSVFELNRFASLARDILRDCSDCKFRAEQFTCGASICTVGNNKLACAACGFNKYQGVRDDWVEQCVKDLKKCEKFKKEEIEMSKSSSSKGTDSSYSPYILTEIDNIIENFHKKHSQGNDTNQTNLNYKLLYIIRDLLIRIEKLERMKK